MSQSRRFGGSLLWLAIVPFLSLGCEDRLLAFPSGEPASDEKKWVSQANELIAELSEVLASLPDEELTARVFEVLTSESDSLNGTPLPPTEKTAGLFKKLCTCRRKADYLIWKLWLVTGHPPVLQTPTGVNVLSESHIDNYRQFVNEHAHLTSQQLHQRGILNAGSAFASPLCYSTLKYVDTLTGHRGLWMSGPLIISSRKIVLLLPDEADRRKLLVTYVLWLARNFSCG